MADKHTEIYADQSQAVLGLTEVLWQVGDLVKRVYGFEIEPMSDGRSLRTAQAEKPREGVQSVMAVLENEPIVRARVEWLRTAVESAPSLATLWRHLSSLSEGVRPLPPIADAKAGTTSYWLELKVQATSAMSLSRLSALSSQLEAIDKLAAWFQSELPRPRGQDDLDRLYADHLQLVKPVYPLDLSPEQAPLELLSWAARAMELLESSINVAVVGASPVHLDLALAALAEVAVNGGGSVGMVQLPVLNAKNIPEIAKQVPGRIVVPVSRIALGTSPYEMGDHIHSLLSVLSAANKPAVFTSSLSQLQAAFHGGQGGSSDPLVPAVMHVPAVPFATLARFALSAAAREKGGVSGKKLSELLELTVTSLSHLAEGEQTRLLPAAATHALAGKDQDARAQQTSLTEFVERVSTMDETLTGIPVKPRNRRRPTVQDNLVDRLLRSDLLTYLKSELFAQDEALAQLAERLQTECLTRSDHQPIRYCAQGTPGTGKSESAALLARFLGIPHVNIDAASQPDYHTASSQLLGSGRGIVGSYEAGRLERVAKHSTGAVVEVSDLDHAPPSVRGHLADLFLQVLDTGEAQSATGAVFSCANLIFAFTINLPEGRDEHLYRGIGFDGVRPRSALQQSVESEIKTLFSNAFLSRIGRPILFSPLSGEDLALIAEREMTRALDRGLAVLGISHVGIHVASGTGAALVESLGSGMTSHGARVIGEHARLLVTQALLTSTRDSQPPEGSHLNISYECGKRLEITWQT